MVEFIVESDWEGQRLGKFLFAHLPSTPGSVIYRAFKKKDVKINGVRSSIQTVLRSNDHIVAYLAAKVDLGDEAENLVRQKKWDGLTALQSTPVVNIAYEDEDLIIVVKPQGIASVSNDNRQPSAGGTLLGELSKVPDYKSDPAKNFVQTLPKSIPFDEQVQKWWESSRPPLDSGFPAVCHRLDVNTGGLLMFAKNTSCLEQVMIAQKNRLVTKRYLCVVAGKPLVEEARLSAWLEKDSDAGRVYIHEYAHARSLPITTIYKTIASNGILSVLTVELVTGRTHQIRAHLARIGHPILGDSKYGSNAINRRHKASRQLLWAYSLTFQDNLDSCLNTAAGKTIISVPDFSKPHDEVSALLDSCACCLDKSD